jgi:hypothetical protein
VLCYAVLLSVRYSFWIIVDTDAVIEEQQHNRKIEGLMNQCRNNTNVVKEQRNSLWYDSDGGTDRIDFP